VRTAAVGDAGGAEDSDEVLESVEADLVGFLWAAAGVAAWSEAADDLLEPGAADPVRPVPVGVDVRR